MPYKVEWHVLPIALKYNVLCLEQEISLAGERSVCREIWTNKVYNIKRNTRPIYPTRTIEEFVPNNALKRFII